MSPPAITEDHGHDERMRRPDLGAVHETVPHTFEYGEKRAIIWVEKDRGRHCTGEEGVVIRFRILLARHGVAEKQQRQGRGLLFRHYCYGVLCLRNVDAFN